MLEIFKSFASCFILMISLYAFGYLIIGKSKNSIRRKNITFNIIVFLIGVTLNTVIFMCLSNVYKTLFTCIVYTLTLKIIFNIPLSKAIFSTIIYIILLLIPEFLTISVIINLLHFTKDFFYGNIIGSVVGNICISIEMIALTILLRKPLKKLFNYNISTNKKIVSVAILTILFITFFFYKFSTKYQLSNDVIFYLLAIFAFMLILFILLKEKRESENIKDRYDDLLEIMKNYEADVEEQRTILHETKNEIMTIRCKIVDKEKEPKILKYIDSILGDKKKDGKSTSEYAKFKYLPSNGLKGFFYYKTVEASKKGIDVAVNISEDIENSFLGSLDTNNFKQLTRIIGVYLDNAIDASSMSEKKLLGIEIYLINDKINIIISNTFENKVEIDRLGKSKYTTKGKNHGHGLLLVKNIISSNKAFESKTEIRNNLFIQELIINKNENEK